MLQCLRYTCTQQSLCGMDEEWRQELEETSTAIASSVGALCLSITTATYLATLTPPQADGHHQ